MKRFIGVVVLLGVIGAAIGWYFYNKVYEEVVNLEDKDSFELFISADASYSEVRTALQTCDCIVDMDVFDWVAEKKSYPELIKPGRYVITDGMSANELVNKLRSGDQDAVKVTFTGVRTVEELCGQVARQIMADSAVLVSTFQDQSLISSKGFDQETFRTMFIPNTYEMWWNSDHDAFVQKMANEYKRFWNSDRVAKANQLGLSQSECTILASIVKAETAKKDEAPQVAGLYLNRLRMGMALQADPTLIYALGNFNIQRVLDVHKEIDSPYNTYKFAGLPPGPINFPEPVYIDAVLNPADHKYIYMCAKPDFSGYHNFSRSYNQHLVYARQYQRALNERRIYR